MTINETEKEQELKKLVASQLSKHRYEHSVSTAAYAKELAKRWQVDVNKAYLTGLLHDLGKDCTREEALKILEEAGITLDADTLANDSLLHPYTGMVLAQKKAGITDSEILEAIRTHTVGEPGMTPLQEIIFLADLLEPGRDFPGVAELRLLVRQDLNAAMSKALAMTIAFVEQKGKAVHPAARAALQYYHEIKKKE